MSEQQTTATEHLRQVASAFDPSTDARLVEIMQAAVKHLHAFVEEVHLTRDEWLAGIRFLTEVGQRCDEVRQEFILLSDVLGVSTLVEMVNQQSPPGATEPTVLGPFHLEGVPLRAFGDSIVDDPSTGGEPLTLHGTVRDLDGSPVPGASVDVWQVQPNGLYDVQEAARSMNLRGVFETAADGRYEVRTVRPVDYTIPDDGVVGAMLRATGRHPWRPAHIHLKTSAPGFKTSVTHVFDAASAWLDGDAVFAVRSSLVASMTDGDCLFDIVLDRT
ncbi:MAG TPA: dioxygenase [Acidimicrobiales bacterium]|nr:dioxygenase [Acidimicrobiales bacterium]